MCNCSHTPSFVADPEYWDSSLALEGATTCAVYFEALDVQTLVESASDPSLASCFDCGQHWYVEWAPEEEPIALFGMKVSSLERPSNEHLAAAKQSLAVLAHGGFAAERCRFVQCTNHALRGRALCHLHFSFP
jgi:hypothetical protein